MDVNGLTPNTVYTYAVLSQDGKFVLGHDKRRRFRTPSERGNYSFGMFSCHNPYIKGKGHNHTENVMGVVKPPSIANMDLWTTAQSAFSKTRKDAPLDFIIAGGDQAYCDGCDSVNIWKYLEKAIKDRNKIGRLPNREEMLSWYRGMYRGYWGFPTVKSVYGQFPTYMIWDDHEIRDGWGSHKMKGSDQEINELLFDGWGKYINKREVRTVISDMFSAAKQAYEEYQHSHNPDPDPIKKGNYDYAFEHHDSLFYVLDGRGHRDFDKKNTVFLVKNK